MNLIGEHVDYCGLAVFPMAIPQAVWMLVRPRDDVKVRLVDCRGDFPPAEFDLEPEIAPAPVGEWGNYPRASAQALVGRVGPLRGIDAALCSEIPSASGLSSSTALVVATALALLDRNDLPIEAGSLATLLAQGERYVGTQGGGMDQAIVLGARAGSAARVSFYPLRLEYVRVPDDWRFVVASSLLPARKSGPARRAYNQLPREAGEALAIVAGRLGADGVAGAAASAWTHARLLAEFGAAHLVELGAEALPPTLLRRWRHVVTEAARVDDAIAAMVSGDRTRFGRLLSESHTSLRDDLEVSRPELDQLVELALEAGAAGARLTGAGFGGCIVALVAAEGEPAVRALLEERYYRPRGVRDSLPAHLFTAPPSPGAAVTGIG